jgi:hypothetical protein
VSWAVRNKRLHSGRVKTNQALIGRQPISISARIKNIDPTILSSTKNHIEVRIAFNAIFKGLF